ncbi:acyltransferas-like protein [Lindgomyces ingoldianus]|uniref:Acyltransferas-like protein n=1 Tax=Lindgomyces ingoldianus TaxID=673940 RepID=A0ACB6QSL7_9PLEO|nr:acyltransferas-like protein [Lindgomyces ingoldianus]KAF2469832.1 acyltransferas-like protein [Lindgomyces ingoldianus]
MPAKFDGLLDHDRMEEVSLKSAAWKPVRASRWSFDLVRPEFLNLRLSSPKKPIRRTAWLDGLRGFAAFMVYIHHNQLWAHGQNGNLIYENAFGYEGRHYTAALPFVRHLFSGGHFAVAIFFVISGYVLSVKSMGLIHNGQFQNSADSVGSALFRRWLRLYIPVIAVTFIWMSQRHWTKIWVQIGEPKSTYREDVKTWYYTFKNYSFVFLTGNMYEFPLLYHPHSWSIPIEFKGSIIVYTALSAFSRCTRNARLWCEAGLVFYFLYIVDGWYGALFMSGMLLCDLDMLALDDQLPRFFKMLEGFKELIFFHLFLVALYLGGVPSYDTPDYEHLLSKSPGWIWLSHLKPQAVFDAKWFYLFWAASLVVASIPRLPWLKQFFEARFCQYLARISFALYLVHGLVIWVLADRLYAAVGFAREVHKEHIPKWVDAFPLSKKGPMGFELAFWAPQLVILVVTLYAAEVVTKLFDGPSVKFSNWVYKKTLAQPPSRKA